MKVQGKLVAVETNAPNKYEEGNNLPYDSNISQLKRHISKNKEKNEKWKKKTVED